MHIQYPLNHKGRFNDNVQETVPIRVALVMANAIDCEVISQVLAVEPRVEVIQTTVQLATNLNEIRQTKPDVLVIDPKCQADSMARTIELVIEGSVRRALVLDDRVRDGLVAAILPFPQINYLTRQSGSRAMINAILQVTQNGERVFDEEVTSRIIKSPRGWRLQNSANQPSVAVLTARELEVLKLLATGRSVRDCAEHLNLSVSTVDNHKTRLMKKLQIHKLAELTHLAIRDGLITV